MACKEKEPVVKHIVLFGDSITAEYGAAEGSYTERVKQKFHSDAVYQHGYCGHRYSKGVSSSNSDTAWLGTYLAEVCCHEDADMIILFGGTNDYGHGLPLGTPVDTADSTSCGGLRYILDYLTTHTTVPIMLCTPFPNGSMHPLSTTPNALGLTMAQYVEAYKAVAADSCYQGRVFINDTFACCGFNPEDEVIPSERVYTTDGLHLSETGYERLTDLQLAFYREAMML